MSLRIWRTRKGDTTMTLSNFIPGGASKADQPQEPPRQRRAAREASAPTFGTSHEGRQPGEVYDEEIGRVSADGPEVMGEPWAAQTDPYLGAIPAPEDRRRQPWYDRLGP